MQSRQNAHGHMGELMDHLLILLVAGDALQIKPAKEIALAGDFDALRQAGEKIHPEHHTT